MPIFASQSSGSESTVNKDIKASAQDIETSQNDFPLLWGLLFLGACRPESKKPVTHCRYCEERPSTQGLSGTSYVCPVGRKEPPKGTWDICTDGGRWWDKDACAQVALQSLRPVVEQPTEGRMKKRDSLVDRSLHSCYHHPARSDGCTVCITDISWVRGWYAESPTLKPWRCLPYIYNTVHI